MPSSNRLWRISAEERHDQQNNVEGLRKKTEIANEVSLMCQAVSQLYRI